MDGITSIASSIVNGIGDLLKSLFVPSDGFLSDRIASLGSKFSWAETLVAVIQDIESIFATETFDDDAPSITFTGTYSLLPYLGGGQETVTTTVDFAWFLPYRDAYMSLASGMIFIIWSWRVFIHFPNIIGGLGGDYVAAGDVQNYMKGGKPRRKGFRR